MATDNRATFFDKITERIELDEQNYVILKAPTYGDSQQILKQSMKFQMGVNKGENAANADVDIVEMEILALVYCIADWGGPGFGDARPSRETILALPAFVIEKIKPHVDRLSGSGKAEKKNSSDTTDSQS